MKKFSKFAMTLIAVLSVMFALQVTSAFAAEMPAPPAGMEGVVPPEGMTPPDGIAPPEGGAPDMGGDAPPPGMPDFPEGFDPSMMMNQEAAGWAEDTVDVADTAGTFEMYMIIAVCVLGVCALAALCGVILKFVKKSGKPGLNKIAFTSIVGVGMVVCLLVVTVGNSVAFGQFNHSLDAVFTKSSKTHSGIDTGTQDWKNLCYDISSEGLVLMRNEGGKLPIAAGKINLLGYRAYDPVYSGSGSGSISADNGISIVQSLESAGFTINPAPVAEKVYAAKEVASEGIGFSMATVLEIKETPLDKYVGQATFDAMKAYSDVAVIVIGRTGGEGADLVLSQVEPGKTYLQLSSEEEALLQKARATFGTVVVIYNSDNAMEMGYLEKYDVDAALWVGIPGPFGFYAIGNILSGKTNPSGKLVDTYVYDLNSNPVQENYANQKAANTNGYYVDYVEGVYLGYKWYETAYAEGAKITIMRG